jgi:two-component system chemotaxis response regulator CheB
VTEPISILIVDDSALYRQSIQNVVREISGVKVAGVARNGVEAIEKIRQLDPDLLTLDVQMPDMDGIGVLREIKANGLRASAIMVSSFTAEGAQVTTDALMEGAFDFILKPSSTDPQQNRRQLREALQHRIDAFRDSRARGFKRKAWESEIDQSNHDWLPGGEGSPPTRSVAPSPTSRCRVVIIGTSTGGPAALKQVLPKFPPNTPAPIVVVQHMPERYTASLAERLDELCPCRVVEASNGMPLQGGQIVVAKGGHHLKLGQSDDGQLFAIISKGPLVNGVRPAVDVLIESAVDTLGGDSLAIILTGMGRDGVQACKKLKNAGGYVFAQSRDDCVVYGMPGAIVNEGLADRVLSLATIAPATLRHLKRSRRGD